MIYIVLEWVRQIGTTFSEAKRWHVSLNGSHDFHDYLSCWILWKQNNGCGGEKMF